MWDSTAFQVNVSYLYNGIHYWQIGMSTVVGSAISSHKLLNKLCNLSFSVKMSDCFELRQNLAEYSTTLL